MIDDNSLISRVLALDDKHAFGTLVIRYQANLRGFLRRLLIGQHHVADDLAQETFLIAYRKLSSFRGDSKFSTWLHRIAYRQCLGHFNADNKLAKSSKDFEALNLESSSTNKNEASTEVLVEQLMKTLSLEERLCIILNTYSGLSHREIADETEIPLGTIKSHIKRGLKKMQNLYNEEHL